jgi:hypothetical protein
VDRREQKRSEAEARQVPVGVVIVDTAFLDSRAKSDGPTLQQTGWPGVRFFEGNVSDYEAFRPRELGAAADQPRRIRYKRWV